MLSSHPVIFTLVVLGIAFASLLVMTGIAVLAAVITIVMNRKNRQIRKIKSMNNANSEKI